MFGTQTICVQSISVSGGDFTNGGACSVPPPPPPPPPTTAPPPPPPLPPPPPIGGVWCDCGGGCAEIAAFECPPGCTPCAAP